MVRMGEMRMSGAELMQGGYLGTRVFIAKLMQVKFDARSKNCRGRCTEWTERIDMKWQRQKYVQKSKSYTQSSSTQFLTQGIYYSE